VAELDENGNPIPGTAAPMPILGSDVREMTDGAGEIYRRNAANMGGSQFVFFMVLRGDVWESVPPEAVATHPATDSMVYVQDLPWDEVPSIA
jgi:hypothetical protein